ncbi:hypothetical protein D3C80_1826350 [compost metagenome]
MLQVDRDQHAARTGKRWRFMHSLQGAHHIAVGVMQHERIIDTQGRFGKGADSRIGNNAAGLVFKTQIGKCRGAFGVNAYHGIVG